MEASKKDNDSGTVGLEVQDESGQWKNVGHITLLDNHPPNEASLPPARAQLPRSFKSLFTATAAERKAYYTFRHAPGVQPNSNLLILLHGAGDSHEPFDQLGQRMALPLTATIALAAKDFEALPFGLGHSWFAEMDYTTGENLASRDVRRCSTLQAAAKKLATLLQHLIDANFIIPERIFLLGYGAGATLAMETCSTWKERPLGGAICVGGGDVLQPPPATTTAQQLTPILLLCGALDESFPPARAHRLQQVYSNLQVHTEDQKRQGMISSGTEMKAVMEFLAARLVRVSPSMNQTSA
jgi:predicted esterase